MRTIEVPLGETIDKVIPKAARDARNGGDEVCFDFNGVTVVVRGDSPRPLILRDWQRGMRGYLGTNPTVGPYPSETLSDDDLASDRAIQAENERQAEIRQAEYARKAAEKTARLEQELSQAGPLEVIDVDTWQDWVGKNADPYGAAVCRYADKWGRLMQWRMSNGETLQQCADDASHMADDEGITGFMYGAAVQMLAKCWKHGEELRRWHNKDVQIGTEGDEANESGAVLNPALLTVKNA